MGISNANNRGEPHQFDIPLPGSIQSKVYLGKMMCFHGEFSTSMLVKTGVIAAGYILGIKC